MTLQDVCDYDTELFVEDFEKFNQSSVKNIIETDSVFNLKFKSNEEFDTFFTKDLIKSIKENIDT